MRARGKVDENHREIVAALRKLGATVQSLANLGGGCPDLCVGYAGRNYLLEVKPNESARLTADERTWHAGWRGQVAVVRSWNEAAYVIGAIPPPKGWKAEEDA